MSEPLDVKFGPTNASPPHYTKDNHSVTITFESNPAPTSWSLTASPVCHGDNSNCSDINLDKANNQNDHISVSEFIEVSNKI